MVRPPDVLVGPEARLIAMRVAGHTLTETAPGVTVFEAAAPGRLWPAPSETLAGAGCGPASCRLGAAGRTVLLVRGEAGLDCSAMLILSAASLYGACLGRLVIDRAAALRDGAAAVWMTGGGADVITDRALRGERPWVLLPRPGLPMAEVE